MTLNLKLSNEAETKLREQAKAAGKDVEGYVRDTIEEKLALAPANLQTQTSSPPNAKDEWLARFDSWVNSHPIRPNVELDDSRESIYAGRGE
jgi:hypothetical protein